MGFNQDNKNTNKNQVVLSMVSKETGKTASWVNLTDTFARSVCKCEVIEVTEAILLEKNVPAIYETKYLELHIKDTTKELETIDPTQF